MFPGPVCILPECSFFCFLLQSFAGGGSPSRGCRPGCEHPVTLCAKEEEQLLNGRTDVGFREIWAGLENLGSLEIGSDLENRMLDLQ